MRRAAAFTAVLLGACVRYQPAPLDPARGPDTYRARRLDDTALVAWVGEHYGTPPSAETWTAGQLAVAALALRPDLAVARGDVTRARAAGITARARPQPGIQGDVERFTWGQEQGGPWVVGFGVPITLELGGKRGARALAADARLAERGFAVRETAWTATREVRDAAWALQVTHELAAAVRRVADLQAAVLEGLETRFRDGSIGASEIARARADDRGARLATALAAAAEDAARTALARAVGVPVAAVERLSVTRLASSGCDWADPARQTEAERMALQNRYLVGGAVAAYAVADAELRVEIARQYPDLQLTPGFVFDQATNRWTLGWAFPSLALHRNRGPIAEATARREQAGAGVAAAQMAVLADVEAAAATCRREAILRDAQRSIRTAADSVEQRAAAAYERGEAASLELRLARVAVAQTQVAELESTLRLGRAAIELESAMGVWLQDTPRQWPDPTVDPMPHQVAPDSAVKGRHL